MTDDTASTVLKSIYTVNLGVKRYEEVLVFTDTIGETEVLKEDERNRRQALGRITANVVAAGAALCNVRHLEFSAPGGHGKEPPEAAWKAAFGPKTVTALKEAALFDKILDKSATAKEMREAEKIVKESAAAPAAVIALSNFSSSHTRFRDFLTRLCNARYASMPLFDESMLTGVMTADWKEVERRTLSLTTLMEGAEEVRITSANGTSIDFSIKGRPIEPDTGILTVPGRFGNLPAGEGFCAPVEGSANGVLVLEWAPTRKLGSPVTLTVKDGIAVKVEGTDEYAGVLEKKLAGNPLFGNIAELGIGTNYMATRPDNILETEKILGTVHIALGDNSSFGGRVSVPFHQDFIFFAPTMTTTNGAGERKEILTEGKPGF